MFLKNWKFRKSKKVLLVFGSVLRSATQPCWAKQPGCWSLRSQIHDLRTNNFHATRPQHGALVDFLKKHSEHSGSQFGFNSTLPSKLLSSPVRSVSFRQNHCSLLSLTARKTEDFSKRFAKMIDHFSVRRLYMQCNEANYVNTYKQARNHTPKVRATAFLGAI